MLDGERPANIFIIAPSKGQDKKRLAEMMEISLLHDLRVCILNKIPGCKRGGAVVYYNQKEKG